MFIGSENHKRQSHAQDLLWAKRGIWVYFWLLIVEGALRKWIFPQLSGPLLLIRDPVVLFICWKAFRAGVVPLAKLGPLCLLSLPIVLLACIQIALGSTPPLIALYGLRSYLLHLTVIIVMAQTFTFEDVRNTGKWILILSVPIALMMIFQYRAPARSWWNAGAGSDSKGQISSAGGHVRASGPFSYVTGTFCFFPLAQAFLLLGLSRPKTYPRWLLAGSTLAVLVAIPLSASRTLLFVTAGVLAFALFSGIKSRQDFRRIAEASLVLVAVGVATLQIPVVHEAIGTFEDRWQAASDREGDVGSVFSLRVMGSIRDGLESATTVPWLGEGIGMGSMVASYLTTGSQSFLLAETEWQRVVLEFGPVLGLGFLLVRVFACYKLFVLAKRASGLSWLLIPATVPYLILNTMEQPTNLGFMVFGAGLCIAAARTCVAPHLRPLGPLRARSSNTFQFAAS
jgi:hypothetical protein